uniref:Dynein heavy chain tail domain-containing protein n=2 Tax=Clytia hemisphaerica TaxID=252671 RepID=A0A7M5UN62_9CNID
GFCLYFAKINKTKEITAQNIHNEITLSVLDCQSRGLLDAVHQTLTDVFIPAVSSSNVFQNTDKKNGGQSRARFINSLSTFIDALTGAQQSLSDVVKLSKCDALDLSKLTTPALYQSAAASSDTLEVIETQTKAWIKEIEQILAETEQMRREADNVGPKAELDHWKKRMSKFNSLLDELKSQKCKAVLGVLLVAKSKLLKTWKEIDKKITDYANEAKDNVKFLYSLEKFCE